METPVCEIAAAEARDWKSFQDIEVLE
jgi:hypothetical protein